MQRRMLAWLAGGAGLAVVLYRRARRRPAEQAPDPAEELRRKLDKSRADAEPALTVERPPDLDERRRDVHERGRAAIDAMRGRDAPQDEPA